MFDCRKSSFIFSQTRRYANAPTIASPARIAYKSLRICERCRLETGKRDIENFEHEIGVGVCDAHRRLDAEGITEQPSLSN